MESGKEKEQDGADNTSSPIMELNSKSWETGGGNRGHKHKGINFNIAVTPSKNAEHGRQENRTNYKEGTSSTFNEAGETGLEEKSNVQVPATIKKLRYDVPLPAEEQLINLTIEEQTSLLALKEMSVVYLKDSINQLTKKLDKSEEEVHKLREVIQRSLYKEVTPRYSREGEHFKSGRARQVSNPRDEAVANTQNKNRRKNRLSSGGGATVMDDAVQNEGESEKDSTKDGHSIWNNISKPLNLFQLLDNVLQRDVEKLLLLNNQDSPSKNTSKSYSALNSDRRADILIGSKVRNKSDFHGAPYTIGGQENEKEETTKGQHAQDDFLHSVSSSIWSFVNEVKTNVMSYSEEVQSETGSPQRSRTRIMRNEGDPKKFD